MIPPLKPGAKLLQADGPVIETARLILRPWRSSDIAANTAMLSDPGTARYIAPRRQAGHVRDQRVAQRRSYFRALGVAWLWHVRGRGEVERPIYRARGAVVAAGLAGP
ncbi:hypothetical protein [Bradyrhizobium sp. AUGA SZCCT0431]|uniref:hypothetical protein n=1 Tax=Bradyrhizobium sp. AUGA SZCCT0431 TaxID=2807674 RepID=UPI002012D210|nr:hypothetical protein [Bradyrhizobium sp. AUGA SZCCT0431]